jgi:hypothetical protein
MAIVRRSKSSKPRKTARRSTKSVARKRSSTKPRKTVRKSSTKRRSSAKKGVSKTFIILKSAKVSSKPLSKQGKKTVTKGTSTHLAVKVALKALKGGKRVKHVFLARKGKVMIFAIKFKAVAGKVKSICAKRIRVVDLKGTSAGAPHQSCLKSGLKRTTVRKRRTVRKTGLKRKTVRKTGLRKRRSSKTGLRKRKTVRKSGTKRKSVRKPRKRTTRKRTTKK